MANLEEIEEAKKKKPLVKYFFRGFRGFSAAFNYNVKSGMK